MKTKHLLLLLVSLLFSGHLMADEVTVGTGTNTTNVVPFGNNYMYSTTETIYTPQEIGGSGKITSISYHCSSVASLSSTVRIYMGHKSGSTFASTSDYMPASKLTLVYDHSVNIGSQTGWVTYTLDCPFEYNASQNLVVVVCKSASSYNDHRSYSTSASGKCIYRQNDNNTYYADVNSTSYSFSFTDVFPNTKFEIELFSTLEQDGIKYDLESSSNTAVVLDATHCEGEVAIPNSVTDAEGQSYTVNGIASNAFKNNQNVASITIPESVTSIGSGAFDGCSAIKELVIEDATSTLSLANSQFSDCPLKTVYVGRNLSYDTFRNSYAPFYENTSMAAVAFGDNVTDIPYSMFFGCSGLTSITIPETITTIASGAFYRCSGIKELVIEDATTTLSLATSQFSNCPLESVYLGRNLNYDTSNASYAPFYNISTLKNVELGNAVTSISAYMFRECSNLKSVTIPKNVKNIDSYAFYD